MIIHLDKVVPLPMLAASSIAQSEIWGEVLQLQPNKAYNILAGSGRGKSSLISFLFGERFDFDGSINFNDESLHDISLSQWAHIRAHELSIVFQDLRLLPKLTAYENIALKAGLNQHVDKDKIRRMAAKLKVGNKLTTRAESLSFGERQRMAIIRALTGNFNILLLDEPFSHLDIASKKAAVELIKEVVAEKGAGLILTSLDPENDFAFDHIYNL